jgi:hypothetical protein
VSVTNWCNIHIKISSLKILRSWESGVGGFIPGQDTSFPLLQNVHTSSGTHQACYPLGSGSAVPVVKAHSTPIEC